MPVNILEWKRNDSGLQLFRYPDLMGAMERILIAEGFHNGSVWYLKETGSTMNEARSIIRAKTHGIPDWSVVTADYQTAGKGRLPGRRWIARSGEALLFTMIIPKTELFSIGTGAPVSLLLGLGTARYLESRHSLSPVIKWPNDVLIRGKKICGILCETEGPYFLAGIGMNCSQPPETGFRQEAASISGETGRRIEPLGELPRLLPFLKAALSEPDWKKELERRLYLRGRPVEVLSGAPENGERFSGTAEGIGAGGALLVRTPDGIVREVYSGEVSPEMESGYCRDFEQRGGGIERDIHRITRG